MAVIHEGRNGLREEMEAYYEQRFQEEKDFFFRLIDERKKDYAWRVKAHRRAIPVRLVLLAASIGLIVLLVLRPEIIQSIQTAADNLFAGWEEALSDAMLGGMSDESAGLGEILLNLLLSFLSLIAALLLWVGRVSSGVLVFLIVYGALGCAVFFIAKGLIPPRKQYFDQEFNEEAARERVRNESLPSEMRMIQTGLEGEERALELLSRLGDDCHIYTNLKIHYDGKVSETDVIVVAPHNVTIVEVKNYRDELVGDWSDEHITLEAERGVTTHQNRVYNPVRQVATHAYRLSGYLREHDAAAQVNRCVFFVNESIWLHRMQDSGHVLKQCPVFQRYQLESLLGVLRERHKGTPGSRVVQLLNELAAEQSGERSAASAVPD